jgi:Protein of unknown function (DUF3991)/Toprim-like
MSEQDKDIEWLKASVSCAVLLERLPPVWRLDAAESTHRSLKYRRGAGEIVIVNHDGRGWWDPLSPAKGDVFTLVRHLDPRLDFGAARRLLQGFAGIAPEYPAALRIRRRNRPTVPLIVRWGRRPPVTQDSPAWRYLTGERGLPAVILRAAVAAEVLRQGPQGSAWFAHRDGDGQLTGIEMRGPAWRRFSSGGDKTLFRFPGGDGPLPRVAVCESAIDALSLAALEGPCADTLYAATAGGLGPGTLDALRQLLSARAADPAALLIVATDADRAGEIYAVQLAALAAETPLPCARLLPPDGVNDWNDALRRSTAP